MEEALRDEFLTDVADAVSYWAQWSKEQLVMRPDAAAVVREALQGLAHSLLVSIDGGTKLSDAGRKVWLTDEHGEVVAEGLHEYLPEFIDRS